MLVCKLWPRTIFVKNETTQEYLTTTALKIYYNATLIVRYVTIYVHNTTVVHSSWRSIRIEFNQSNDLINGVTKCTDDNIVTKLMLTNIIGLS